MSGLIDEVCSSGIKASIPSASSAMRIPKASDMNPTVLIVTHVLLLSEEAVIPTAYHVARWLTSRSRAPDKMGFPRARVWPQDFLIRLFFSVEGVRLRSSLEE